MKVAASAEAEEIAEEEITDAEGELKNNKTAGSNVEGTEEDKKPRDGQPTHEAYASVIFDLSVIAEIATYKSSVVGVRIISISFSRYEEVGVKFYDLFFLIEYLERKFIHLPLMLLLDFSEDDVTSSDF